MLNQISVPTGPVDLSEFINQRNMLIGGINRILPLIPVTSSGIGAPGSTPSEVGDIYIDTQAKNVYISAGTSSSADWVQV